MSFIWFKSLHYRFFFVRVVLFTVQLKILIVYNENDLGPAQTIARIPFTKPTPAASVQYPTFARRNLFVAPLFNPFARIYHRVPTYNPYFFLA